MMTRYRNFVFLALLLWSAAFSAFAAVDVTKLRNGLTVVIKEEHHAPVVTVQVWYRVGSAYEQPGVTGISHALEHMMFKGTKNYSAGEFSRVIAELGGQENAFTSRDFTAYFQTLGKHHLETSLKFEADRMQNLLLTKNEFDKEIEVVKEERRLRTEDNPNAYTEERANAMAFILSPYRHPVVGWMEDLERLAVHDLQAWYTRFYAPNNATVVVVGDVDKTKAHALVEKYFSHVPAAPSLPVFSPLLDVPASGERRMLVQRPAKLPYILLGYPVPTLREARKGDVAEAWEPYALELLSVALAGGDGARLSRHLVRGSQLASHVGVSYQLFSRLPDLFNFEVVPAHGRSASEVETALRAEIAKLKEEPLSLAEMEHARAQILAEEVYNRDSIFYQAMILGILSSVELPLSTYRNFFQEIQKITPEQIQQVARKYLVDDQLTVTLLQPQPSSTNTRSAPPGEGGRNYAR